MSLGFVRRSTAYLVDYESFESPLIDSESSDSLSIDSDALISIPDCDTDTHKLAATSSNIHLIKIKNYGFND